MTEILTQPHFEGMSKREILESQEPVVLVSLRAKLLEQLSDVERDIHLINDILDGYGVDEEEYTEYEHELNIVRGEN